ncbi:hypothetical protein R1flu_007638 [Riccia fluitans]|uniref:Uncharacterized protein n=1 Tax=Riccia fluitans TaxID=41844 RepID=A0ABD1Z250_9MARC
MLGQYNAAISTLRNMAITTVQQVKTLLLLEELEMKHGRFEGSALFTNNRRDGFKGRGRGQSTSRPDQRDTNNKGKEKKKPPRPCPVCKKGYH